MTTPIKVLSAALLAAPAAIIALTLAPTASAAQFSCGNYTTYQDTTYMADMASHGIDNGDGAVGLTTIGRGVSNDVCGGMRSPLGEQQYVYAAALRAHTPPWITRPQANQIVNFALLDYLGIPLP
jgi:hypothetical protein